MESKQTMIIQSGKKPVYLQIYKTDFCWVFLDPSRYVTLFHSALGLGLRL